MSARAVGAERAERAERAVGAELLQPDELLRSIERTDELLRSIEPICVDDQDWSWVGHSYHSMLERNKERSPWKRAAAAVAAAARRGEPAPPLIGAPLRQCG